PEPLHFAQGLATICPLPRHRGQVVLNMMNPRWVPTWPAPAHCGQVLGCVPARAPEPPHSSQGACPSTLSSRLVPFMHSSSVTTASTRTSAPRGEALRSRG